jgi:hypothetical protein
MMPLDHESDFERHYTIRELSKLWHLSYEATRRLFVDEPGVLRVGGRLRKNRRGYQSMRVPASIARKVYRRVTGRHESAA